LTIELEELRETYELKLYELQITLDRYQTLTVSLQGELLERDTRLAKLEDVEKQLATWKAHHDSMENNKREL